MTPLTLAFWTLVTINATAVVCALLGWHNARRRDRVVRDRSLENLNRAFGGSQSWMDGGRR
jgi:hypothetical protein